MVRTSSQVGWKVSGLCNRVTTLNSDLWLCSKLGYYELILDCYDKSIYLNKKNCLPGDKIQVATKMVLFQDGGGCHLL